MELANLASKVPFAHLLGVRATRAEEEEENTKKSKYAEEEPEAEDEDEPQSAKNAKLAERKRCKAIFNCSAAGARPDMAAYLAFDTNLSVKGAVKMLNQAVDGEPRRSGLNARMAGQKLPNIGSDSTSSKPKSMAQSMMSTYDKLKKK